MGVLLDPNDETVIAQARRDGVPDAWLEAARRSPVWKMAMEWKVAFPLHPEYRTLPMVWYVPPLSPIQSAADAGKMGVNGAMPDVRSLRIPLPWSTIRGTTPAALLPARFTPSTIQDWGAEKIHWPVSSAGWRQSRWWQLPALARRSDEAARF